MNITTLAEFIELFEVEIVKSGFKRDLNDLVSSIPNQQGNIIGLREIANQLLLKLNDIYNTDLPENLSKLLPLEVKAFTSRSYNLELKTLIDDTEIQLPTFFAQLNQFINLLNQQIQLNITEIDKIKNFIAPYLTEQAHFQTEENKAIISIIFKDKATITGLKEFSKTLQSWNKILPLYHQILKSTSPEEIEIITVQNGSIDFVVNIDVDVALDLAQLFKIGFKCFMAYLSYKAMAKPLVDSYFGNKKLIEGEKEREKELINNIGEAVKGCIIEQHKNSIELKKVSNTNIDKQVEQVVNLVTNHILKGNDLKLLTIPERTSEEIDSATETKDELRSISSEVRQAMKLLPNIELKALLEKYIESPKE